LVANSLCWGGERDCLASAREICPALPAP